MSKPEEILGRFWSRMAMHDDTVNGMFLAWDNLRFNRRDERFGDTMSRICSTLEGYIAEYRGYLIIEFFPDGIESATMEQTRALSIPEDPWRRLTELVNTYKVNRVVLSLYAHAHLMGLLGYINPLDRYNELIDEYNPR